LPEDLSPPASSETPAPAAGLFDELSNTLASARAAFSNFLDLVSLEARRASLALVWMVAFAFIAAICIVSAWLGLMAALVLFAVMLGLHAIAAILIVAAINLGLAAALLYRCKTISRDVMFSATRRQVAGKPPVKPA